MLTEHFGLVHSVVWELRRQVPFYIGDDDLVASGMLGLVEAWNAYDSAKNNRFGPYAYYRIKGAIIDFLRKTDLRWSRSYRGVQETPVDCFGSHYADHSDPCEFAGRNEIRTIFAAAILKLPERERAVITLYYYEDLRFVTIAVILGLSRAAVRVTHQRALSRLKSAISRFPSFLGC